MLERILNGDEAMAHGALASGVSVVTSYPGSPSSGTVAVLSGLADPRVVRRVVEQRFSKRLSG